MILLPDKFLKWFNVTLSALSCICGIILAAVGGANSGKEQFDLFDVYDLTMNSYIAFGVLYIIIGTLGLVASLKENTVVSLVFSGTITVCSIAFLAIGVVILTDWDSTKTDFEDDGCSLSDYKGYEEAVTAAKAQLCVGECPCGELPEWLDSSGLTVSFNSEVDRIQQCPNYDSAYQHKSNVSYLKTLEEEFDCAGFCTHPGYKLFSGITSQPKSSPCLQYVLNDMEETAKDYGYGAIIVGLTFLLSASLAFCFSGVMRRRDYAKAPSKE